MSKIIEFFEAVLKYFVPAFLLFLGVGFASGWGNRDETVRQHIYSQLKLQKDATGRYYLAHTCEDKPTFSFDVSRDSIHNESNNLNDLLDQRATMLDKPSEQHIKLFGNFLGGTTGGITIQQTVKYLSKPPPATSWLSHAKKTVLGIIGGITGYALGDWLGSNYDTDCHSDLAQRVFADIQTWRKFEVLQLNLTIKEALFLAESGAVLAGLHNVNPLANNPIFTCNTRLSKAVQEIEAFLKNPASNPGSHEFALVSQFKADLARAMSSPAFERLRKMRYGRLMKQRGSGEAIIEKSGYTEEAWLEACSEIELLLSTSVD